MSIQLFKLRGVPDDEAEELRLLLHEHQIDFYETGAGLLGFSTPAFWLRDVAEFERATQLITAYQQARYLKAREHYHMLQQQRQQPTVSSLFRNNPWRYILYLAVIGLVLYLSIKPFVTLMTH